MLPKNQLKIIFKIYNFLLIQNLKEHFAKEKNQNLTF